jgi:DNA-binding response OmpR family regulator
MKILIVDDEPIIRRSLERAATLRGHTVKTAADGEEGGRAWLSFDPDLVFLDVLMPVLSGPQLLQSLETVRARVILMSAYTGEYNLDRAKELGADLFLAKPFQNIFEVIERGEELVHGRKG